MSYDPSSTHPHDPSRLQPSAPDRAPGGGLAISGFVCAMCGLPLACLPGLSIIGVPPLVVGLVLSAVGLTRHTRVHRGLAVAGLVLALVGLPVAGLLTAHTLDSTGHTAASGPSTTAPPATTPSPVPGTGLSTADSVFLQVLDDHAVARGSAESTISLGHSVCGYLARGGSPDGATQILLDNGFGPQDAAVITGASIGAYCPAVR